MTQERKKTEDLIKRETKAENVGAEGISVSILDVLKVSYFGGVLYVVFLFLFFFYFVWRSFINSFSYFLLFSFSS